MEAVVESCIVYLIFRNLCRNVSTSGFHGDFKKNRRDKRKSSKLLYLPKTNSFYERWTWSSRSTMLPLGQSQRPVILFLFLSSSLPAFHHLFNSVALRLVPMRLLFPLVFTVSLSHGTCTTARSLLLGPRCCQIVCESYGQKAFAMLRFPVSSPVSLHIFAIFCACEFNGFNVFNVKMN